MRLLSHAIGPDMPVFPGAPPPRFDQRFEASRDGRNSFLVSMTNHTGTHLDAPRHVFPSGSTIGQLPLARLMGEHPVLVDIAAVDDDDLIGEAMLAPHLGALRDADMALIRTRFGARYRTSEPARYSSHSPGFHPSAARWVRYNCPRIRLLIMDIISAGSPTHPQEGAAFHAEALQESGRHPVLLVEDAKLDLDLRQEDLGRVLVVPLLLAALDAAPTTVVAGL